GMCGWVYLLASSVLNLGFVGYALKLKFADSEGHAWATFKYSIWHLLALFVVLLLDHWLSV
ncbi:protoheme IX farnesyltransferase, partial [Photobacterium damselae]